jgi:hypothetical protein
MSRKMAEAIEAVLRMHADEIAPDIDLSVAATIIEALLVALSHRAAMAGTGRGEGEVIAAETTCMITRYLAAATN